MLKRKRESEGVGANEMGANVMGANVMGANEMGANEMGANEMGANEMGANEMGANEMGTNEIGANEMDGVNSWSPGQIAFTTQRLILRRYLTGQTEDRCTICLEELVPKMALYLPCKHTFHYTCWQRLVEQQTYTCPLCRANFSEALPGVGVGIVETPPAEAENMMVLTIFTTMDMYDFMMELLWQNYQQEAERELLD
jgi:hypothetical protein